MPPILTPPESTNLDNVQHCAAMSDADSGPARHRWELSVLCYHKIRVNYPYPFLAVIFMVILHDFISRNYHKTVQSLPFSPLYGK